MTNAVDSPRDRANPGTLEVHPAEASGMPGADGPASVGPYPALRLPPSLSFLELTMRRDPVLEVRVPCPQCASSENMYCRFCLIPLTDLPTVDLPLQVDILQHAHENKGKTTVGQCCILSPRQTRHFLSSEPPAYTPAEAARTVLLFPDPTAQCAFDLDPATFDRVLILDGTWKQAKWMARCLPALAGLRRATLAKPRTTDFWRYQKLSPHFVSSMEAIYYFCQDTQAARAGVGRGGAGGPAEGAEPAPAPRAAPPAVAVPAGSAEPAGSAAHPHVWPARDTSYDDLLGLFIVQYDRIQRDYQTNLHRSFTTRMPRQFVQYSAEQQAAKAEQRPREIRPDLMGKKKKRRHNKKMLRLGEAPDASAEAAAGAAEAAEAADDST